MRLDSSSPVLFWHQPYPQCLQLTLTPGVVETFPGLRIGCLLLEDIEDYSSPEEQCAATAGIVSRVEEAFASVDAVVGHYLQAHYAAFYRQMGLKPKQMSTPITQVQRILKTHRYRSIHRVVDQCMEIEYRSLVSLQVYDFETISGSLDYTIAYGDEVLVPFHQTARRCHRGELIARDALGPIHSSSHGNSARTAVIPTTSRCLVRVLGVPGIHPDDLQGVLTHLRGLAPRSQTLLLSATSPTGVLIPSQKEA